MSYKTRLAQLAAIVLSAGAVSTGCASQSHAPRSQAFTQLVAVADPICKEVATKREAANAKLQSVSASTAKSLSVLAQVAPGISAYQHHEVHVLSALTQSGSKNADWHTMLAGMEHLANDTSQLAADARAKNIKAVRSLVASGHTIQHELAVIAGRDGFTYCGRTS